MLVGRVFFGSTKKSADPSEQRWSLSWARCRRMREAASSCHSRATPCGAPRSLQRSCRSHRLQGRCGGQGQRLPRGHGGSSCSGGKLGSLCGQDGCQAGPSMFGKPLTEAQLLERFQSCLKTSAQGVKFVKAQGHAGQRAVLRQRGQAHQGARLSQGPQTWLRCSPASCG